MAYIYGSKNLGDAEAPPPWDWGVADSVEICSSLHVLYLAKCGRSRSNDTSIITEISRKKIMTNRIPPFKAT